MPASEQFFSQISKKVVPVHLDIYFSSYDHFHFDKVHLVHGYIIFNSLLVNLVKTGNFIDFWINFQKEIAGKTTEIDFFGIFTFFSKNTRCKRLYFIFSKDIFLN